MGRQRKKKTGIKVKRSIRFKIMVLTTIVVLGVMLVCTAIMQIGRASCRERV